MTAEIIAENILKDSHFLSATEEEGEYIGQPDPADANTGAFRLLASGDVEDFTYSGTATTDGAGAGVTVIDIVLARWGDDFFIGGTVAVTDYLQDSADYVEVDGDGRLVLTTANKLTITDMDNDEDIGLYIDKTADHFDGDFEFHTQVNNTGTAGNDERVGLWAVTNSIASLGAIDTAVGDYIAVYWLDNAGDEWIVLEECNAGSLTNDTSIAVAMATEHYLKIVRDESVGTYGTVYCYIYSDVTHSTLVDTLTLALTEKQDFRYLYWMTSYESGGGAAAWDGTIQNFEIVKSESGAINDFVSATGTMTVAGLTYQVNIGTSFTLTIPYSTRKFITELITSGDAGSGKYKWSHNDGTTYLGRLDPGTINWPGPFVLSDIDASDAADYYKLIQVQADNGDLLDFYCDEISDDTAVIISTDKGITWGTPLIIETNSYPTAALVLKSGRIWLYTSGDNCYSDDNGVSWTMLAGLGFEKAIELDNGNILAVATIANAVLCWISTDKGFSWSTSITIASDANDQSYPSVVQSTWGYVVCVYQTDEDAINDIEIKCKISYTHGSTWGNAKDVLDFGAVDIMYPDIISDIDGTLYVVARSDVDDYVMTKSVDSGATWSASAVVLSQADTLLYPTLSLVDGHIIDLTYVNDTDQTANVLRTGRWLAYAANACPAAINAIPQHLVCDVNLIWHGGAGIDGDIWTFEAEHDYAAENLISDSVSKPWRSKQDNIGCSLVIDMGANNSFLADGIGFFGCNVSTLDFHMNAADTWAAPTVDETVSFVIDTGTVSGTLVGNALPCVAFLADYKVHELKGKYFKPTAGTDSGLVWKILDNDAVYIYLDTTSAHNILTTDTFSVFQSKASKSFTNAVAFRYINIAISAQKTAEGYYQIGMMVAGKLISLSWEWSPGFKRPRTYDIDILEAKNGGMIPIKYGEPYNEWALSFPMTADSDDVNSEIVSLFDSLDGKNLALIPSNADYTDCYPVKLIGGIDQTHVFKSKMKFSIRLRESR